MRARRHGKPHQGSTTQHVRRPNQRRNHAGESDQSVVLIIVILPRASTTRNGFERNRDGKSPVRHDTRETFRDRRAVHRHCTQDMGTVQRSIFLPTFIPAICYLFLQGVRSGNASCTCITSQAELLFSSRSGIWLLIGAVISRADGGGSVSLSI